MSSWTPEFRQIACLLMANPHSAAIFWGDDLTVLYNQAYAEREAGTKHPGEWTNFRLNIRISAVVVRDAINGRISILYGQQPSSIQWKQSPFHCPLKQSNLSRRVDYWNFIPEIYIY